MKITRAIFAVLVCACLCATLPALAGDGDAVRIIPVVAKDLQQPGYNPLDTAVDTAASGANAFALRLSAALLKGIGDENFVCSPYSVWMPLAALVNAVDEPYREKLLAALDAAGIGAEDLNRAASRMLYDLTRQDDKGTAAQYGAEYYHDPLKIANAIFVSRNATLKRDFAQVFMDAYRGTAMSVDFSTQEAADAVNAWASENTDGMITDIVQGFDPAAVAAIANAIYFSDRWDWEFSPEETAAGVFHAPAGDTEAFYMLREGGLMDYYEDDTVQAMPLEFKTGGGLLILLPKDGDAAGLLASMTPEDFQNASQYTSMRPGKLLLPRFSIAGDAMELGDALSALGLSFLFDPEAAPLTGNLVEEDIPVWLSGAVHKAAIEVDEKGTTAAAVTVMALAGAARPEPAEPFEMICDRPFAFVLYGRTYDGGNQVLFTGVVHQP